MQIHPLHHTTDRPQAVPHNGARTEPVIGGSSAVAPRGLVMPGLTTQSAAALGVLAGLWVAVSPWFLTLQTPRATNATVNNLIIGLAIAAIGMLVITGATGASGLEAATVFAGAWLIVSPFILAEKFSITTAMYWSNIWAGGVVMAVGLATMGLVSLDMGRLRAAR